ncbi:Protein of unknown function (DUF1626) [Pyrobaculum oguniense TE7]|uniref:DUF3782 domain-containing protein n=1 Tax=Pyrobaculum oguniense (strain DSM 13380 / JCM 10595 / TE7) TaxID=698757 RepID=H6QA12_PYROT|nr:Protein of unknown function (DUF1626) [Pyrobaculum oguniense TE7]
MRAVADAIKALADYVRTGFQEHRRFDEVNKRLKAHESFEVLAKSVGELKVAMGSLGRRWGRGLEMLALYKHALEERVIEPDKVERFIYTDVDGRYYRPGARLEIDVYIHDDRIYLIEVKSHAELEDVERLFDKARIVERILNRWADKVLIVAVNIDKDALERAKQLGIDVIYGSVIDPETNTAIITPG